MIADTPRLIPIHQSAYRPTLIKGCDRGLILTVLFAAFCLAFSLLTVWGFAVSAALWLGAVAVLRRMGKAGWQQVTETMRAGNLREYFGDAGKRIRRRFKPED